jgi:hypothetical protein
MEVNMWLLLVGCAPDEVRPASACDDEVLELARDEGVSIPAGSDIVFSFGGQGGFHADLGAWVRTQDTAVALIVRLLDAQGDVVAQSSEVPTYVALADHTEASCEGWAVTRTYLGGSPQLDPELACTYDGQVVMIEVEATPLARVDSSDPPLVLSVPGHIRTDDPRCE